MRKILKVLFMVAIFIIIFNGVKVWSIELSTYEYGVLRNGLSDIGLDKTSINNIIIYVNNLELSKEEGQEIVKSAQELYEVVEGKEQLRDFGIGELVSIYRKASTIADNLKLGISYNLIDKNVLIKDKNSGKILVKADSDKSEEYIDQIKSFEINTNINNLSKLVKGELNEVNDTQIAKEDIPKVKEDANIINKESIDDIKEPEGATEQISENSVIKNDEKKSEDEQRGSEHKIISNDNSNDELSKLSNNEELFLICTIAIMLAAIITLLIKLTYKWIRCYSSRES